MDKIFVWRGVHIGRGKASGRTWRITTLQHGFFFADVGNQRGWSTEKFSGGALHQTTPPSLRSLEMLE